MLKTEDVLALEKVLVADNRTITKIIREQGYRGKGNSNTSDYCCGRVESIALSQLADTPLSYFNPLSEYANNYPRQIAIAYDTLGLAYLAGI